MTLKEKLENLEDSYDCFDLKITKELSTWIISYETDYGYLMSKDEESKCYFEGDDIEVVVDEVIEWIKKYM